MRRKERRGNILVQISNQELQQMLYFYFDRKLYNVFCPRTDKELSKIIKNNAITYAFFDDTDLETSMRKTEKLLEFDDKIVFCFVCSDEQSQARVLGRSSLFHTLLQPYKLRNLITDLIGKQKAIKELQDSKIAWLCVGNFKLNAAARNLVYKDDLRTIEQHLTKKECGILAILIQNQGKIVSRHRLLIEVWGKDNPSTAKSMDVYFTKLRKYLLLDSRVKIVNQHSLGYSITFDKDRY